MLSNGASVCLFKISLRRTSSWKKEQKLSLKTCKERWIINMRNWQTKWKQNRRKWKCLELKQKNCLKVNIRNLGKLYVMAGKWFSILLHVSDTCTCRWIVAEENSKWNVSIIKKRLLRISQRQLGPRRKWSIRILVHI